MEQAMSLFDGEPEGPKGTIRTAPLAERMSPRSLEELSGQEHLVGPGKPLRVQIERDDSGSMILWGPPGVGKTTLAKIIAETTKASFIEFSAVMSGIKEIKQVMVAAAQASQMHSRTILFVDEIHRFNKAQQDAFLPYVERGTIRLIGATTENPSFEIISALLSRCRVYVLEPLTEKQIAALLRRAVEDRERGLGALELTADDDALELIASYSSGDCRNAYNTLEVAAQLAQEPRGTTPSRDNNPVSDSASDPVCVRARLQSCRKRNMITDRALARALAPSSSAAKPTKHIDKALASLKPFNSAYSCTTSPAKSTTT
jgi:putative ATPase